jgi:hypothetical protein
LVARLGIGSDSSDCRDRLSNRSEFLDEPPVALEHKDGERLSGTIKPELIDLELDVEGGFCHVRSRRWHSRRFEVICISPATQTSSWTCGSGRMVDELGDGRVTTTR